MWSQKTLGVILVTVSTVTAHGYIDKWTIGGTNYTGFNPTTAPWAPDQGTISWSAWNDNTGPVYGSDVKSTDLICSINATNSKTYASSIVAGSKIDLHWTTWPDSHHGPIFTYLAACNGDCIKVNKTELK